MMWKTINTNSNYEISDNGDIKSLYTKRKMKLQTDKDGYLYVKLYDKNLKKYKHCRVHRLVLENFDRMPINEKEECHHIDGNRQNNNITNLQWVTRQENDSHVIHTINNGSYTPCPVYQLDLNGNILAEYESMSDAAKQTGCSVSKISLVCNGKRHTHGGYIWQLK